jgi:hypothetical protein
MIINNEWRQEVAEIIAERLTFHLLDVANNNSKNELCGCLMCLSKIAVDVVLDLMREESEINMMRNTHDKNIKNNNVN